MGMKRGRLGRNRESGAGGGGSGVGEREIEEREDRILGWLLENVRFGCSDLFTVHDPNCIMGV